MNMPQIVFEAMSPKEIDKAVKAEARENYQKLLSYAFPITEEMAKNANSYEIEKRVTEEHQPVTFEWVAEKYSDRDVGMMIDLAKSILPKKRVRSIFFSTKSPKEQAYYARQFPELAALKCDDGSDGVKDVPTIFERFLKLIGKKLNEKADNTFVTTYDKDGVPTTTKRDDEAQLNEVAGSYYSVLEEALKTNYVSIMKQMSTQKYTESEDVGRYAAFLRYIFQYVDDARKQRNPSTGEEKKIPLNELFGMGSENLARKVLSPISGSSLGAKTNWGSVLNAGNAILKRIDPSRLTNSNLDDIYIYPQYVVDVLSLTNETIPRFCAVLKNHNYGDIAEALSNGKPTGKEQQNTKLDITSSRLIAALKDKGVISDCLKADLADVFKKWGNSWVTQEPSGKVTISLDKTLAERPRMDNADENTVRAVGVAIGQPKKRSNTFREYTGEDIVDQAHRDMTVAKATVVKNLSQEKIDKELERMKMEGVPLYERLDNLKTDEGIGKAEDKLGRDIGKDVKAAKNYKGDAAETSVVFFTDDGKSHTYKVGPQIDIQLAKDVVPNVFFRKSQAGVYFIAIPHGVAFVTMQNKEGDIIRNDTPDTLTDGLTCNNKKAIFASVKELMNSAIGRYSRAVAHDGKTGRIRFSSPAANKAYTQVLAALKEMKAQDLAFPDVKVTDMTGLVTLFKSILSVTVSDEKDINEILKPFSTPGNDLTMTVETYNPATGKFVFNTKASPKTLVTHLKEMYNLGSPKVVMNVLNVLVPNRWNLSEWNYSNVVRAAKAMNAEGDEDEGDVQNAYYGDLNDAFKKAYERVFPNPDEANFDLEHTKDLRDEIVAELAEYGNNEAARDVLKIKFSDFTDFTRKLENVGKYNDADTDGQTDNGTDSVDYFDDHAVVDENGYNSYENYNDAMSHVDAQEDEESIPDTSAFGDDDSNLAQRALDSAIRTVCGTTEPSSIDVARTSRIQTTLAGLLAKLQSKGFLRIKIAHAVQSIQFKNYADFRNKYWSIVADAIEKRPGVSDNRLRMDKFVEDDINAYAKPMYFTKQILRSGLDDAAYDGSDRMVIPVMGALMIKYATDNAIKNNSIEELFDSDYLVESFNENFTKEYDEKKSAGTPDFKAYAAMKQKIDADPEYITKVANIVVKNADGVVKDVMGVPVGSGNMPVQFDAQTARTPGSPGRVLVDFCLYNVESDQTAERDRLHEAFGSSNSIRIMLEKLRRSVPSECLSIDYGNVPNGPGKLDTMDAKKIEESEWSNLKSYYGRASTLKKRYGALKSKIDDIYRLGRPDAFVVDAGDTSPYTYHNEMIDLGAVHDFFTSLMTLASTYNDLGTSEKNGRVTERQVARQMTLNNEVQRQKVLINSHFMKLKASFDSIYNGVKNGSTLTEKQKNIVDMVMNEVVMNPMNVLINNNARLITAFAYYEALVGMKAERDLSPTGREYGFGSDAAKGLGKEGEIVGRNSAVDTADAGLQLVYAIMKTKGIREKAAQIEKHISPEKAKSDFEEYFAEFGSQYPTAADLLNSVSTKEELEKKKGDRMFFCDYAGDIPKRITESESLYMARVRQIRTSEMILLMFNLSSDILNSVNGHGYGNDMNEYHRIMAAQGGLVNSDAMADGSIEILSKKLLTELVNVDAELALATGAVSKRGGNNPAEKARGVLRGREKYPQNKTNEFIDELVSDDKLDVNKMQDLLVEMGRDGNPTLVGGGSAMNLDASLDVLDVGDNNMLIHSNNKLKLRQGDCLVIRAGNAVRVANVQAVAGDAKLRNYYIDRVYDLKVGDKTVPFSRFQSRNVLSPRDLMDRFDDVIVTLGEWHDDYPDFVPADIIHKLIVLNQVYRTSACSDVMKSAVSYYAWRASNYREESLKPQEIVFKGAPINGSVVRKLVLAIVEDLKKFGPGGELENLDRYDTIWNMLPDDFREVAAQFNLSVGSPSDVKAQAKANASIVRATSLDVNQKNILSSLVAAIGKRYGRVKLAYIDKALQKPEIKQNYNITDAEVQNMRSALNGEYKNELDNIIKEHAWRIAEALVKAYKNSDDTPTFDGAIQYIKDNLKSANPLLRDNPDEFGEYVRSNFAVKVKYTLGIS